MKAAAARTRVLVAGHVTLDRYAEGDAPGGAAYYAAGAHRALGAEVRVATAAGADFPREALAGAEAQVAPSPRTSTWANVYDAGGRRRQRVEAEAVPVAVERVPEPWLHADLLHLAPVLGEIALARWLARSRARLVGIGVQGWVRARAADGTVLQPRWEVDAGALAGVAAAVVGEDDLEGQGDLLDRLTSAVPVVAFTRGARGCEILLRGRAVHVGVYPTRAVDPTGAGDVFSAALFLALARGAHPVDAARLGAAAASVVVEGRAGAALGRIGEAERRAERIPVGA